MLPCIAAVAIATFVGKKTFESYAYETRSLLMQNVEALAGESDESGPEDNLVTCNGALWLDTWIKTGKVTTYTHYTDTTDKKAIYPISKCCASHQGEGKLRGDNTLINFGSPQNEEEVECIGPLGHRTIGDVISEYFNKKD